MLLFLDLSINIGKFLRFTDMYLTLKAQEQCTRNAKILATFKNPPIVYAKQANISQGHQQINNDNHAITHAQKTKDSVNEVLSDDCNAALDTRGTIEENEANQKLATV